MKVLVKVEEVLTKIELYIGMFFSGMMIVCLTLQVLFRKVFNAPLSWTEELGIIFFILSVYTGSVVAISRGQHLKMEILTGKLKPIPQRVVAVIANVVWGALMIYLTAGIRIIIQNLFAYHSVTPITGIPKYLIYSVLPVCFLLMVYHLLMESLRKIQEIRQIKAGTFEEVVYIDVDGEKIRADEVELSSIDEDGGSGKGKEES